MRSDSSVIDYLAGLTPHFWSVTIVFFGVGDLITTRIGLSIDRVIETGPIAAIAYQQFGLVSMVPLKFAVLVGAYIAWLHVPAPHNIGIPLGLAVLGVLVTLWNLSILFAVV